MESQVLEKRTESELLPTQEIGSIAKPAWRVKGVTSDASLTWSDIKEAEFWGSKLDVPNYTDLIALLKERLNSKRPPLEEERTAIREWSVLYALRMFESVGLSRVYSGEQWRVEMYEHFVRNVEGFKLLGSVQSFDYKYYTKASVVSPPKFRNPIHLEEFLFVKKHSSRQLKVPITGPYTIVDWTFNEFYETDLRKKKGSNAGRFNFRETYFDARRRFILDLVRNVFRPEISVLTQNGANWIQIDEPAVTTHPDKLEMDLFVEAINELTRGFENCTFSLHNCYSDYRLLAKYSPDLKDITQLALEFANRDSVDLGQDSNTRPGYQELSAFEDEGYRGGFGLGVVHVHDYFGEPRGGALVEGNDIIESPKLIRDRILYASKLLKDPSRISVNPDCGLRTRSWEITYRKLQALSEGAKLARQELSK